MKKFAMVPLPVFCISVLIVSMAITPLAGKAAEGDARLATTKQLMAGLNGPHCSALGKGLKEGPTGEEAWDKLAIHAAVLNEVGYLLMDSGRCPDGDWAGACKTLREESANVLQHIQDRDAEGAQASFKAMTKACGACHSKHKKS